MGLSNPHSLVSLAGIKRSIQASSTPLERSSTAEPKGVRSGLVASAASWVDTVRTAEGPGFEWAGWQR